MHTTNGEIVGGNGKRTRTSDTLQAPVGIAAAHVAILALLTVISLCVVLAVKAYPRPWQALV